LSSFNSAEHLFWWLIAGSKGGKMRARILLALIDRPMNANQITELLGVNYRTTIYHLEVLVKHGLLVAEGPDYGKIYFPSKFLEYNKDRLMEIIRSISK
jgi:predicted transcriptional regulator